jgi:hypothetical protein
MASLISGRRPRISLKTMLLSNIVLYSARSPHMNSLKPGVLWGKRGLRSDFTGFKTLLVALEKIPMLFFWQRPPWADSFPSLTPLN